MTGEVWGDPHEQTRFTVADTGVADAALQALVSDRYASRLAEGDGSLWGPEAQDEASRRIGWVDLSARASKLVEQITRWREEHLAAGLDRIVLCGMGGSSLAPEVVAHAHGVDLVVLDSSHPDMVRQVVEDRLDRTVVVVSSKSGSTVETDSHRRVFTRAFREVGIDPATRIIVVTDPGSALALDAEATGQRVVLADPDVGGRYSALSAFGLVPSGLAGADIAGLLAEAEAWRPALSRDDAENPGLRLGVLMGCAVRAGVDKGILVDANSAMPGFGDWIEQLVAESTGKEGTGLLPVAVPRPDDFNAARPTADTLVASYGPLRPDPACTSGWSAQVDLPLGAQFLLWEHATAVTGRLLDINPFDQPDVERSKAAARTHLDGAGAEQLPLFTDGPVTVYASPGLLDGVEPTVADAVSALLDRLDPERGYLAVEAFVDRLRDERLAQVRDRLAVRTRRPVTFGWGPRFLHSTGQYHKGGPAVGVHLQVTGLVEADLAVPDRPFTFGEFINAQAAGDAEVLAAAGQPVLRLHLGTPEGLERVIEGCR